MGLLRLGGKVGETILMGDGIEVTLVAVRGNRVLLGIVAPRDVPIHRSEVREAIDKEQATACST